MFIKGLFVGKSILLKILSGASFYLSLFVFLLNYGLVFPYYFLLPLENLDFLFYSVCIIFAIFLNYYIFLKINKTLVLIDIALYVISYCAFVIWKSYFSFCILISIFLMILYFILYERLVGK